MGKLPMALVVAAVNVGCSRVLVADCPVMKPE